MASKRVRQTQSNEEWSEPPLKRKRSSDGLLSPTAAQEEPARPTSNGLDSSKRRHGHSWDESRNESRDKTMAKASTAKSASQTVETFLTRHIPHAYAPLGSHGDGSVKKPQDSNSKFCYRHRPDMLCRRQADEPSMDKLQKDLESISQDDRQGISYVWSLFSAAPPKQRNLMLQGILAQCCFPQLSFLSANVRELIRIDFLAALPAEVSFRILCFLDTTSLCKAAQVSRRWRQLADDDVVWHRMCEQHIDRKCTKCGWGLPLLERKRLRASKRQIQLRATGRGINEWSPDITPDPEGFEELPPAIEQLPDQVSDVETASIRSLSPKRFRKRPTLATTQSDYSRKTRPWKDVYKDRFKVGSNWKYGRCSTQIFSGHANGVMCLQFYDNILATGSYDATIKIWDIESGKELRTLRGHTSGVRCLQFDDNKLISGSLDTTLRVWNWRTGECISTYNCHTGGVVSLHFDSNILVSGSVDRTARIWNFEDKSTFALRGHTDWVSSVKIDSASRTVFTASDDLTVKMWDLDTKQVIRTYEGHTGQVQQILLLPHEFELEEHELLPNAGDAGSPVSSPEATFAEPPGPVQRCQSPSTTKYQALFENCGTRPAPPQYMLTSGLDSTIRLWDVPTGRCIRTLFGHVEGVWALAADTLRIVSGAEDRMIKVWDPRTGKCDRTFTGHAGPVTCIGLSDSRMCSGSEDGEVRMYSFKND